MSNRLPDPVVTSIVIDNSISQEELLKRRKDFVSAMTSIIISGLERQREGAEDCDKERKSS